MLVQILPATEIQTTDLAFSSLSLFFSDMIWDSTAMAANSSDMPEFNMPVQILPAMEFDTTDIALNRLSLSRYHNDVSPQVGRRELAVEDPSTTTFIVLTDVDIGLIRKFIARPDKLIGFPEIVSIAVL
jgi:hypothetical protein